MLTIEHRPMNEEERAALEVGTEPWREGCVDGGINYFIHLVGLPLLGMLLAAPVLALLDYLYRLPSLLGDVVMVLGTLAGLLVGMRALRGYRSTRQESRSLARQDLAGGQVRILHCTVSRAVEFPVDEDVGPGYFLEVGENQVLYLHSSYLLDFEGDEDDAPPLFPNRAIDVVQAVVSKATLSVVCLGEPLAEWQMREEWPEDAYLPTDGELLTISLDTLDADLKRLEAQK
jgi:hypothetical protein